MIFEQRKNINRGYRKLIVWNDAIEYYVLTCNIFKKFPFELKRVSSQAIACSDSIHRNIAEGYCRRSIKEYLNFLNISKGSMGESVSGLHAYYAAGQLTTEEFNEIDGLAYKLENGLLKLIESLENKDNEGDWNDSLMIRESNSSYSA
ncbi:MAG: four helix bundle protein [Victivallales bacterium]|jgi:four helix bundle protein